MEELRALARTLLTDKTVGVVIGWEAGPRGARPTFVTKPEDAERLIFDPRCVQNLAAYLNPRRAHIKGLGKPAVVVKACDARAVAGLIRESQLKREDVVLVGVRCGGVLREPSSTAELSADTAAEKCLGCEPREPAAAAVDHLVGEAHAALEGEHGSEKKIEELRAMSHDERFAFWAEVLSRCLRCNACRQVCPLCFCERCAADKTDPQWIESSPHPRGNFAFHMTRALHLAGRCVECGECERICPVGIPLGLIGRRVAQVVEERYGHRPTDDPDVASPIGSFKNDDSQEFIR